MFPGQGSQATGMGGELFDHYPGLTALASELIGRDLVELCLDNPGGILARTEYTQPALFVVNAFRWFELQRRGHRAADYYLGHSLGEYNALLAAGVFDFATGLRLVCHRGKLMAEASGGGMTAVIGVTADQLRDLLTAEGISGLDIAAHNTDDQHVVAGPTAMLDELRALLAARQIRSVPLRVSAAFHSRYMADARLRFERVLAGTTVRPPDAVVLANATGQPYEHGRVVELLGRQLVEPVRWADSIRFLIRTDTELDYEEIGGNSLTRMTQSICATDRLNREGMMS